MAGAGGIIKINPGLYMEQVIITIPDVQIMGMNGPNGEMVVIRYTGGINGISVRNGAHNFRLSNVVVKNLNVSQPDQPPR